jgi:lathosterol oxidase
MAATIHGAMLRYIGQSLLGGVGSYVVLGTLFELLYYRRRDRAHEWKCQPRRWASPEARREEILLGTANVAAGSTASGLLFYYVSLGGCPKLYFSCRVDALPYTFFSTLIYYIATDLGLYWAHRLYHSRPLYRAIHCVHHRWISPTAFTAAAMHPVELATYHSIMVLPIFFVPLNAYALLATVALTQYRALSAHSGVKLHSWLPFGAPAQFHDDHHVHFHVNYGQNMLLWDRLFGTVRRKDRRYGADVFGGNGAPAAEPRCAGPWDYGRGAADEAS